MKLMGVLFVCASHVACATTAPAGPGAETPANSVRVGVGAHGLDESYWSQVDQQLVIAFEYVRETPDAPLGFEAGFQTAAATDHVSASGTDGIDTTSTEFELYGGLHKTFRRDSVVQPFVGAGVTYVEAGLEVASDTYTLDDNDTSIGYYVHGGLQARIANHLVIGLDLRIVRGTAVTLFDQSGDADYEQALLIVALGF
jgi:opacity protein-like surface antigen